MKSVGESMAIGRSFEESFQKALRSLEVGVSGWECDSLDEFKNESHIKNSLRNPTSERILLIISLLLACLGLGALYWKTY